MSSKILYKYRDFEKYTILGLYNQNFWLPIPNQLNDPFDAQLAPIIKSISENEFFSELESFVSHWFTQGYNFTFKEKEKMYIEGKPSEILCYNVEAFVHCFNDLAAKIGIYSLSETNLNSTMWSHYGDEHRGICIGYKAEELLKIKNISQKTTLLPVKYCDEKELTRNAYLHYVRSNMGADVDLLIDYIISLMATKTNDWAYEKEWRLLVPESGNSALNYNSNAIQSISFGIRTPVNVKNQVREFFSGRNIEFYQSIRHQKYIGLDIEAMDTTSQHWNTQYESAINGV
ncbi:DUF2971 domain-containing protein [Aliivibrio salmonicida]|uniref:DUF2971 domain-containing protein n=1 Tax=Aliivibrio salmonicida TaxID=40269 RepID=UPI00406CA085